MRSAAFIAAAFAIPAIAQDIQIPPMELQTSNVQSKDYTGVPELGTNILTATNQPETTKDYTGTPIIGTNVLTATFRSTAPTGSATVTKPTPDLSLPPQGTPTTLSTASQSQIPPGQGNTTPVIDSSAPSGVTSTIQSAPHGNGTVITRTSIVDPTNKPSGPGSTNSAGASATPTPGAGAGAAVGVSSIVLGAAAFVAMAAQLF